MREGLNREVQTVNAALSASKVQQRFSSQFALHGLRALERGQSLHFTCSVLV